MDQKNTFQFLNESPVSHDSTLDFGHPQVISTLNQIILFTQHNLTIGLFGSWGTGKSTIIEHLQMTLKTSQIPLVIFDVWKHEGDALRRTFLKELDDQLSSTTYGDAYVKKSNILSARVYSGTTLVTEDYKIKLKKLIPHLLILCSFIAATFLPMLIFHTFYRFVYEKDIMDIASTPAITSLLTSALTGGLLFKYFDIFIKVEKTDTKQDRYGDPHEFESEFRQIVANLKDDRKKLVICFDNLDRVSGDNALKVISTIKTFLDHKNTDGKTVFFLIPCDIQAIKNHITVPLATASSNEQAVYIDEFLRKFFNTSIYIPEFYPTELENFASTKLKETRVNELYNDYLSWLITRVFNQNPRQIVQFVNLLLANYLLLREFCKNGGLDDKDFHKNNVPQLAKFLLVKQRYPDILDEYRKTNTYNLYDSTLLSAIDDSSYQNLLNQTEDIYISSLEPFFKYRVSKHEQMLPGITKLLQLMNEEDPSAQEYALEIGIQHNTAFFCSVMKNYLKGINNPVIKLNFINQIFSISIAIKIELDNGLKRDIINTLCADNAEAGYSILNPLSIDSYLFKNSANITIKNRKAILLHFTNLLVKKDIGGELGITAGVIYEKQKDLLSFIAGNKNYLNGELKASVIDVIKRNYQLPLIKEIFFDDVSNQSTFVETEFKDSLLGNELTKQSLSDTCQHLKLLATFEPKSKYAVEVLTNLDRFCRHLFTKENFEQNLNDVIDSLNITTLLLQLAENTSTEVTVETHNAITKNFLTIIEEGRWTITRNLDRFTNALTILFHQDELKTPILFIALEALIYHPEKTLQLLPTLPFSFVDIVLNSSVSKKQFIESYQYDPSLRNFTKNLLNTHIRTGIIIGFIENDHLDEADEQLYEFRDSLDLADINDIRLNLHRKLAEYAEDGNSTLFSKAMKMSGFIDDNDRELMSQSEVWLALVTLLLRTQNEVEQEKAYQIYNLYESIMDKDTQVNITEMLLSETVRTFLTNHYYVHELIQRSFHALSKSAQDNYWLFLFRHIFTQPTDNRMFIICFDFLKENKLVPLNNFTAEIEQLLNTELKNHENAYRFHDLLKEVLRKLKPFKDENSRRLAHLIQMRLADI